MVMSKTIADLEKEIGPIDHEPNQKQIDGDFAAQLRAAKEAREAEKSKK